MQQNNENRINPDTALQTMMVVWFALLASQFLLVGMVYVIKPELLDFEKAEMLPAEHSMFITIAAIASVSILAVSLIVRRSILGRSVAEQNVSLVQTAMIAGIALSEGIVLIGMLLGLVADYKFFFLFGVLGVIGVLIHRPTKKAILDASFSK
jgi:hypothetical protein